MAIRDDICCNSRDVMYNLISKTLLIVLIFSAALGLSLKSGGVLGFSNSLAQADFAENSGVFQDLGKQLEKAKESLQSLLEEISGRKKELNARPSLNPLISPTALPDIFFPTESGGATVYDPATEHERAVINVVKKSSPAVVSVVVYKNVPLVEQYFDSSDDLFKNIPQEFRPFFEFRIPKYRQKGTEKQQIGGGSGFVISSNGLILTNKHVAADDNAEYSVVVQDGKEYKAKVLARDPVQDLAVLKIGATGLATLPLGNSDKNVIGQTVIAIGNALGEFKNTVSVGVVSGLGRKVAASGVSASEIIEGAIQTDAAINQGNSGGPLLNLRGEVIGINTAMAFGAENIGFAIPINKAKKAISSVEKTGKISTAYLGVRYQIINLALKEKNNLAVDYGAWIKGDANKNEPAVISGSAADKAGLKEGDIVLEIDGKKINEENTLAAMVQKRDIGDIIILKIIRENKIMDVKAVLGEM